MVHLTVHKLDSATRREWETLIGEKTEYPTFAELEKFLDTRMNTLEALRPQHNAARSTGGSDGSRNSKKTYHATNSQQSTCCICSGDNFVMHCQEFRTETSEQRKAVVSNKNLCFNCLGSHRLSECKSAKRCLQCSGQHYTLLHMSTSPSGALNSNTATIMEETLVPRTLERAFVSQRVSVLSTTVLLAT